jgi:hypothetical protein
MTDRRNLPLEGSENSDKGGKCKIAAVLPEPIGGRFDMITQDSVSVRHFAIHDPELVQALCQV